MFTWFEMDGKVWRRSEWARQLVAYEKEKLGKEWFKSKRGELISKLFLIALLVVNLYIIIRKVHPALKEDFSQQLIN